MSSYSDNFAAAGITSMDQVEENPRMILWSLTIPLFSGRQIWPQSISRAWNHPGGSPEEEKDAVRFHADPSWRTWRFLWTRDSWSPILRSTLHLVAGLRKRYFRRKNSLEDVYVISIFSVDILVLPPHQPFYGSPDFYMATLTWPEVTSGYHRIKAINLLERTRKSQHDFTKLGHFNQNR